MTSPHVGPRFSGMYEFKSRNKAFLRDQYQAANHVNPQTSGREMFELLMTTNDDVFRSQGQEPAAPRSPQDAYVVANYRGRIIGLSSHDAIALKNMPNTGIKGNSGCSPDNDAVLDKFFKKRGVTSSHFRTIDLDALYPSELIDTYGHDPKGRA